MHWRKGGPGGVCAYWRESDHRRKQRGRLRGAWRRDRHANKDLQQQRLEPCILSAPRGPRGSVLPSQRVSPQRHKLRGGPPASHCASPSTRPGCGSRLPVSGGAIGDHQPRLYTAADAAPPPRPARHALPRLTILKLWTRSGVYGVTFHLVGIHTRFLLSTALTVSLRYKPT